MGRNCGAGQSLCSNHANEYHLGFAVISPLGTNSQQALASVGILIAPQGTLAQMGGTLNGCCTLEQVTPSKRPCIASQDVVFSRPSRVHRIAFRNNYTASVTIRATTDKVPAGT